MIDRPAAFISFGPAGILEENIRFLDKQETCFAPGLGWIKDETEF